MAGRLISKLPSPSLLLASRSAVVSRALSLHRVRPILSLVERRLPIGPCGGAAALRCFSTRPTTSSLNDPSPNWSNRPPKETILLDGCDFEHWLVVMEPPDPNITRDEIIDSYIKTLAQVVGSEDEARMKIYSVSTKHYFAFGALVSEELSYKIKTLPKVRWVLPDSYLDVKNKDYGGEPFIDGQAVPYDPKYHEEWVRNNARANERSRRNDRPRNFDRSRNFERRRENMQNFQNRDAPMPNQGFQNREAPNPMPPRDMPPMPGSNMQNAMPPRDMPSMHNSNVQNAMPPRDMPPMHNSNVQNAMPPRDMPPIPNRDFQNRDFNTIPPRDNVNMGGPGSAYQNQMPNPQNSYAPNNGGSMPTGPGYQGNGGGYQGGGPGYQGGGPGYQGGSQGYQGGGQGYQGGGPGYQGGGPGYQGSGPTYQGGGSGYPPGGPSYQGGGPGYQGGGPGYPGRDRPGRDE